MTLLNRKVVHTCCVIGGHKRGGLSETVSFFRIPSYPRPTAAELLSTKCKAWIAKIHREDWVPSKYSRVILITSHQVFQLTNSQ